MFWKLVKYELQSVRKWYLGIYGIAILLSIPLGLMLHKLIFTFEHSHEEPSLLFFAFFTLMVFATIIVWGTIYIATMVAKTISVKKAKKSRLGSSLSLH